jgi:hypothetical protein
MGLLLPEIQEKEATCIKLTLNYLLVLLLPFTQRIIHFSIFQTNFIVLRISIV